MNVCNGGAKSGKVFCLPNGKVHSLTVPYSPMQRLLAFFLAAGCCTSFAGSLNYPTQARTRHRETDVESLVPTVLSSVELRLVPATAVELPAQLEVGFRFNLAR